MYKVYFKHKKFLKYSASSSYDVIQTEINGSLKHDRIINDLEAELLMNINIIYCSKLLS